MKIGDRDKTQKAKNTFFVMLILAILSLIVFPLYSEFYHEVHSSPRVYNGVLDLQTYDLDTNPEIPLDGKWEFYYDKWIVTNPETNEEPDYLVKTPLTWNQYSDDRLHNTGKGSYRIVLKNCPEDLLLFADIKNINSRYRIYINGELTSGWGDMKVKGIADDYPNDPVEKISTYKKGVAVSGGTAELIVELSSNHVGGLYIAPTLTEFSKGHMKSDVRNMIAAAIVGILLVLIGSFIGLFLVKDKSLSSLSLLLMDIFVFIKICFQNSYLYFFGDVIFLREYMINTIFDTAVIFLPVVFLLCVQQLMKIKIEKTILKKVAIYELAFMPFILWASVSGWVHIKVYLCLAAFAPFILIIIQLYRLVKLKVPNALTISAILMLLLISVITSTLVRAGNLVIDIALFPPMCFTFSMIFQQALYIQQNLEMQKRAIEAENLRLRLKESEMELRLSQIKPHFIYNTLIAIHMLCTEEPETAAETVLKFSAFLRTNMNFISSREPIAFRKELEHIRNYADIEKLRFQERLEIKYDIETEDFAVPPLTIQPLVENGIRHGACKNIDKGVLSIKTIRMDKGVRIEIADNGPGFDTSKILGEAKEPHGIQNIMFRLKEIDATVEFESQPDKGCIVRIFVPKEGLV